MFDRQFVEELLISSIAQRVRFALGLDIKSLIGNPYGRSPRGYRKAYEQYQYDAQAYVFSEEFEADVCALCEHPEEVIELVRDAIENKGIPIQKSLLELVEV